VAADVRLAGPRAQSAKSDDDDEDEDEEEHVVRQDEDEEELSASQAVVTLGVAVAYASGLLPMGESAEHGLDESATEAMAAQIEDHAVSQSDIPDSEGSDSDSDEDSCSTNSSID